MSAFFMPKKSKEEVINKVVQLAVDDISPNPHQPRRHFDEEELLQLAESIKQNGIIQPLSVRRVGDSYELIAGERRLRASKLSNLECVPCIIVDTTERCSAAMSLVENIQRQDLSFFDEAYAIEKLMDFYGMTQEDTAVKLGKAQSTIANKLRLLKLTPYEMDLISKFKLTERHARALLKLNSPDERAEVIEKINLCGLNVEKTEKLIDKMLDKKQEYNSIKKRSVVFKDVRLFLNTINKAVETMQAAGIQANSQKVKYDDYIEYVIKIPVNAVPINSTEKVTIKAT